MFSPIETTVPDDRPSVSMHVYCDRDGDPSCEGYSYWLTYDLVPRSKKLSSMVFWVRFSGKFSFLFQ
jgi:hypothetical protein